MTDAIDLAESLRDRPHVREAVALRPSVVAVTGRRPEGNQISTFTGANWPEWSVVLVRLLDDAVLYVMSSESWADLPEAERP